MTHLDLCSGIGGFALAASWVWEDHRIASFVEIDDYCQRVLRKHWPDAPIHGDIHTFDARPLLGRIDLCTGGYPCQPFSLAGKRQGEADDRHIWPEVRRVIEECRPRWCLFENVVGHVTMGLDSVLADLEGLGYTAEAAVIPACAVDARHRRFRVWIIASMGNASGNGFSRECLSVQPGESRQAGTDSHRAGPSIRGRKDWPSEPRVGRVANGLPAQVDRLRALGNAIVPQVAAEIMRTMKEHTPAQEGE
jgi:DNA (cytosine-5)-methyltransferase 1